MLRIAVIGGGPAGLTAAIEGAKKGFEIDLFEQYQIGDQIRCAEGFFDTLNVLEEPIAGVRFKTEALDFKVKDTYSFPTKNDVNLWMIDRKEWQIALGEEARKLGVTIHENSSISKAKFHELTMEYDWVIDGSGGPSVTSKANGWQSFYLETSGMTVQYTMLGDFSRFHNKIFAALLNDYAGYYWIFPKSDDEANVGLIVFEDTRVNLWHVLEGVIKIEKLDVGYERTRKLGGICPVVMPEELVHGNVLLTGDAAGLVSALHGGGIDNACISAKIAIDCIANGTVDQYDTRVRETLGTKLEGERQFANVAYTVNPTVLEAVFKLMERLGKSIGEYGFLTGRAAKFLSMPVIKTLLHSVSKK